MVVVQPRASPYWDFGMVPLNFPGRLLEDDRHLYTIPWQYSIMFWSSKPNGDSSNNANPPTMSDVSPIQAKTNADPATSKKQALEEKIDRSIAPLPETMSCQVAFDQAAKCAGLGGKFRHNYRYGGTQSCSHLWSDFGFCMRTRGMPDDVRKAQIKERYREKEVAFLSGPNSEDVWQERDKPLEKFCHLDPDLTDAFKQPRWKEELE
jgi:uncharacterized protein DUF3128